MTFDELQHAMRDLVEPGTWRELGNFYHDPSSPCGVTGTIRHDGSAGKPTWSLSIYDDGTFLVEFEQGDYLQQLNDVEGVDNLVRGMRGMGAASHIFHEFAVTTDA